MTGPVDDSCQNITTWSLIIGIGSPFVFYISPIIWVEIHPVIALGSYVIYLLSLIFLALTQFSDPGIIPRKEIIEKQNVQQKCKTLLNYLPEQEDPNVYNFDLRNKICATCQVKKPPRSHHCAVCDNCVEIFDHHCPWVNNCIGRNNYAYFLSFIFSLVITSLFLAAELLCYLILVISNNEETAQILLLILLIPLGVALLFLLVLIGFHTYLLIRGKTTKEQLKSLDTYEYPLTSKCDKTRSLFNLRMLIQISSDEFVKHNPEIFYSNRILPHVIQEPEIENVPIIISQS